MSGPLSQALSAASTERTTRAASGEPFFFSDKVALGNNAWYSSHFGYFSLAYYSAASPYIYKFDFGFLYYLGDDGSDGAYFYDFNESDYFYTTRSLYSTNNYAYIYSFNRSSWLFYFEASKPREFYDYAQGRYIFY